MLGHPGDEVVAEYLASAAWRERRGWWFQWFDEQVGGVPRCECCGAVEDVDLLHVDFANFRWEQVNDVVPVCGRCWVLVDQQVGEITRGADGMPYFMVVRSAIAAVSRAVRER